MSAKSPWKCLLQSYKTRVPRMLSPAMRRRQPLHSFGRNQVQRKQFPGLGLVAGSLVLLAVLSDHIRWEGEPSAYEYTPLPADGYIRLIRLKPGRTKVDDPIYCKIEHFDRAKAPDYVALSYTWGLPEMRKGHGEDVAKQDYVIHVGSRFLSVTQNLYDFLDQISYPQTMEEYLWIDAVCINQLDLMEKNEQVSRMDEIYRAASQVLVWLGKDDRRDGPLVSLLVRRLSVAWRKGLRKESFATSPVFRSPYDLDDEKLLSVYELPQWRTDDWLLVGLFFNRSWFRRVWVVQEVVLSKSIESVRLLYGNTVLSWNDVSAASMLIAFTNIGVLLNDLLEVHMPHMHLHGEAAGWTSGDISMVSKTMNGESDSQMLKVISMAAGQDAKDLNAYGILVFLLDLIFPYREASDTRDKVFALLGVVNHMCRLRGLEEIPLMVDYTKSSKEVWSQTARDILEATDSLNFLSISRSWSPTSGLPSWAIGFSDMGGFSLLNNPDYDASRSRTEERCSIYFKGQSLHLHGCEIGSVEEVSVQGMEIEDRGPASCLKLIRNPSQPTRTKQSPVEVLWRVLNGDQNSPWSGPANEAVKEDFSRWLRVQLTMQNLLRIAGERDESEVEEVLRIVDELAASDKTGVMCTSREIRELSSRCSVGAEKFEDSRRQLMQMVPGSETIVGGQHVLARRRLYRTEKGDVGLGPQSMQTGDKVWIIRSSRVPFVLRPVPPEGVNCYHLLGKSYVHGVMHGEALDRKTVPQWQQIQIL